MATKEELEEQLKTWDGVNKYLADDARGKLKDKNYEDYVKPKPKKSFNYYKEMTVKELRKIAKRMGIKGYSAYNEDGLIERIMEAE